MASNDIHFELYVCWTRRGQTHYRRLSGVAEPLHSPESPESDEDASPPPPRTGTLAVPHALFLQAFRTLPTIASSHINDIDSDGTDFNLCFYEPEVLDGLVVDLYVLFSYIEATIASDDDACPFPHQCVGMCRLAVRARGDIEEGECVGGYLELNATRLPAGAQVSDSE